MLDTLYGEVLEMLGLYCNNIMLCINVVFQIVFAYSSVVLSWLCSAFWRNKCNNNSSIGPSSSSSSSSSIFRYFA